jgi:Tfp pilus assembly protein PilF
MQQSPHPAHAAPNARPSEGREPSSKVFDLTPMRLNRKSTRVVLATACLLSIAALLHTSSSLISPRAAAQSTTVAAAREAAYRANNLGVALLEQFRPKEAADEFRRALKLNPRLTLARTNLAIALFNVPDVDASRAEGEMAAAAAPDTPQPHYVLGMIAKQQGRIDDALASFRRVLAIDARDVGANVQTGQLLAQQRKYAEAAAAFRVALEAEPYNGTALYNLGTALLRSGARAEGQATMQRFQDLRASGAATVIGQNYLEQGRYAEAVASTGAESDLVDKRTPAVVFTDATAAAFGRPKSERLTEQQIKEAWAGWDDGGDKDPHTWHRKTGDGGTSSGSTFEIVGADLTPFDFDGDGDLDLLDLGARTQTLYRNDRGKFIDVTAASGALALAAPDGTYNACSVSGDYDNDGHADLFVLRHNAGDHVYPGMLFHNDGGGKFSDRSREAGISAYTHNSSSVAFVDFDHDGDLDIFIAGANDMKDAKPPDNIHLRPGITYVEPVPAPNMLLRNNGDGTFKEVTAQAKVEGGRGATQVIPTDYDNRRDVDLLLVNFGAPPLLYRNMRDGTFKEVGAEVGLGGKWDGVACAAAGDVNKDGFTDFFFAVSGVPGAFALSDGRGRFRVVPGPVSPAGLAGVLPPQPVAAQFLDYDNDGLLDLVALYVPGQRPPDQSPVLRVWRNVGDGWADVSATALPRDLLEKTEPHVVASVSLISFDFDGDGDTDIFVRGEDGALKLLRNEGGNRNHSLSVRLAGKVSNRGGVEAKVELRAGSLQQKLETYAATPAPAPADVLFGLGSRRAADAVRVIWPSGVVQAETELPAARPGSASVALNVLELDRKPSSCPYLYTWNGSRFEFVTDFMGGGEMGAWAGPGQYNLPDSDEYVRIRGEQLREKDGRYELRVTNELEEVLFVDRLQLLTVAHPVGVEVFPNEGLGNPTGPGFKLYAARGLRAPRAAKDGHGRDVLARLDRLDRTYPDDFKLLPVRGYAEEHTLTLDLGKDATLLLLTGWTDYAWSSDNVGASQRGLEMRPPSLQVRDREGKWRTVIESMGFPVGRPQTVTVDLKGKFLSESREVRIVTNMRVYWDRALVGDAGGEQDFRVERLEAAGASLRERGFSAEVTPDGREPYSYDYARVTLASPWKTFTGRYTRTGDVRELLLAADDMYVVSKPGDELALSFDAAQLKPLPAGWTRTFLLYADGFSKEMDINSASPHEVAPLPFHGMRRYPYSAPETYPQDEAHQDYLERYNTRVVASPLPALWASGR